MHKKSQKSETLRKVITAKIAKSENCKNCEKLRKKVSKSETLRKVKTAKIAKTFTIHYTAVIFQKKKIRSHKASEIEVGILPKVIRKANISWKKHYADQKSKNPL